jgi:enoyl-CoA hydratase/carnithine racemase
VSPVVFERDGAVAVVTLSKPPHNLIDHALLEGLASAYGQAVRSGSRCIVLRSAMRHFCAGADLDAIAGQRWDQPALQALWAQFEDVPVPTVAAVHGAALGGGFELALMCDMVIAADTASIGMAEASLGLIPLLGGVQRVAQRAGVARAKEMAMFARRHDARALERWGVVNLVTTEAELSAVSLSWARQLAAGPTVALNCIKTAANLAARGGIADADDRQAALNEAMWRSNDQARGLAAFRTTGPGSAVFEGN